VIKLWNTGCNVIFNRTDHLLSVEDGEDKYRHLTIEPGEAISFRGTIFPWCSTDDEVTTQAFRFKYYDAARKKFRGWFYMFQNFVDNRVYWTFWDAESPFTDRMDPGAPPSSYVDVEINADTQGNPTVKAISA
jgi:hypothetical protein